MEESINQENFQIEEKLQVLEAKEHDFRGISKCLFPFMNQSHLVLMAIGIVNRTLSLNFGFATLIRSRNFIAASHLIRLNFDSYLRFHAARLVDDREAFATEVLKGTKVSNMKSKNGEKLTDRFLKENAAQYYPWMQNVYDVSSGFVHLSRKHVFTSFKIIDTDTGRFETAVSKFDKYVPDVSKIEAIDCMIAITDCLIAMFKGLATVILFKGVPGGDNNE